MRGSYTKEGETNVNAKYFQKEIILKGGRTSQVVIQKSGRK